MIEKWVNFKRDYLEISFLREKWVCAISPYHRRFNTFKLHLKFKHEEVIAYITKNFKRVCEENKVCSGSI